MVASTLVTRVASSDADVATWLVRTATVTGYGALAVLLIVGLTLTASLSGSLGQLRSRGRTSGKQAVVSAESSSNLRRNSPKPRTFGGKPWRRTQSTSHRSSPALPDRALRAVSRRRSPVAIAATPKKPSVGRERPARSRPSNACVAAAASPFHAAIACTAIRALRSRNENGVGQ
jgi:hypothetical protein